MALISFEMLFIVQIFVTSMNAYTTKEWCNAAKLVSDWAENCANPKQNHMVCKKTTKCKAAANCKRMLFSNKEKEHILSLHNNYRNKIALGTERKMPSGKTAANMMALNWDENLELLALCHGNDCPGGHDLCRAAPPNNLVGQNFAMRGNVPMSHTETNKWACAAWYDEVAIISDPQTLFDSYAEDSQGKMTGHFTAMIWAKTEKIGCVWHEKIGGPHKPDINIFCDYMPAGNIMGDSIFKTGPGASLCPKGVKRNKKYKGLCGNIRPIGTKKKRGVRAASDRRSHTRSSCVIDGLCWMFVGLYLVRLGI